MFSESTIEAVQGSNECRGRVARGNPPSDSSVRRRPLEGHISLWRTRRETLVWLVTLIIQTGTVSLWRPAGHVGARAKTLSVHRRFERLFSTRLF